MAKLDDNKILLNSASVAYVEIAYRRL